MADKTLTLKIPTDIRHITIEFFEYEAEETTSAPPAPVKPTPKKEVDIPAFDYGDLPKIPDPKQTEQVKPVVWENPGENPPEAPKPRPTPPPFSLTPNVYRPKPSPEPLKAVAPKQSKEEEIAMIEMLGGGVEPKQMMTPLIIKPVDPKTFGIIKP